MSLKTNVFHKTYSTRKQTTATGWAVFGARSFLIIRKLRVVDGIGHIIPFFEQHAYTIQPALLV